MAETGPREAAASRTSTLALVLLGGGALVVAALWLGPLPAASGRSFTAHMVLHLGLVSVAAPLLGFGLLRRFGGRDRLPAPLLLGLVASLTEMAVVWGWHLPSLHEAASLDDRAFAIQQASFLLAGAAVWVVAFADRSPAASGVGVLVMLATFMHMTMLGTVLAVSPKLVYSPLVCQGVLGLGSLDDQRLGGTLMATAGGLPYLAGGLALAARLIGADAARVRRRTP